MPTKPINRSLIGDDAGAGFAPTVGHDPELEAALKAVLQVIYREHPLQGNQILTLAAELQRVGVHRLVEEHLRKFQQRRDSAVSD